MTVELTAFVDNGTDRFELTDVLSCTLKTSFFNPVDTLEAQLLNVSLASGQTLRDHLWVGSTIQFRVTETIRDKSVTATLFTGWIDHIKWDRSSVLTISCRDSFSVVMDAAVPIEMKTIAPGTHLGTVFESLLQPFGLGFQFDVPENVKQRLKVSSGYKSKVNAKGQTEQVFAPGKGAILLEQNDFKIERNETCGSIMQLIARRAPMDPAPDGSIPSLYLKGAPDAFAVQLLVPNYRNSLQTRAEYFQVEAGKNTTILDVSYDFDLTNQASHFIFMGKIGGKTFQNSAHKVMGVNPLFCSASKTGKTCRLDRSIWSSANEKLLLADLNHKDLASAELLPSPTFSAGLTPYFGAGKYPLRLVVEKDEESRTMEALRAFAYRRRANFLKEAVTVNITARGWTYENQAGDPLFYALNHTLEWSDRVRNLSSDLWIGELEFEFDGRGFQTRLNCFLPFCI